MSAEEVFTLTWRLKHFNMYPVKFGSFISSPPIRIRKFGNSTWSLILYPKGCKEKHVMGCYLKCNGCGVLDNPRIQFSMYTFGMKAKTSPVTEFRVGWCRGYSNFISWNDVEDKPSIFLPNGTLTIWCKIKCKSVINLKNPKDEIIEFLSREYMYGKISSADKCCVETTVLFQKKTVVWSIQQFLTLPVEKQITLSVYSAMNDVPSLLVTLLKYPKPTTAVSFKIKLDEKFQNLYVRFKVTPIDVTNDHWNFCCEYEHLFETDNEWTYSPMDLDMLVEEGYFKHSGGSLHLRLEFSFSSWGKIHSSETPDWNPVSHLTPRLSFPKKVFPAENDELSIVTLRASNERTFKVHRSILEERSNVFAAMFENDMKEKNTGVVDIPNVAPDVLERMLSFLYCGTVDAARLRRKQVEKLYSAAHMYQILPLMDLCLSVLVSALKVNNVCRILCLADLHNGPSCPHPNHNRLMTSAMDFVKDNFERVLTSQDWKDLMASHPSLAADVMYKMLMN